MSGVSVKFWGTRGSIPSPGSATVKYGGNTSCVELRFGASRFVFDSGTGIRELGLSMMREGSAPFKGHIFIGHTHWDHIQGFPFFVPAYVPKNRFVIHSVKSVGDSFETIFKRQMGLNYFPVEVADMAAQLEFRQLDARPYEADGVIVKTAFTNHPGVNLAYRLEFRGGPSVVYLTDHENYAAMAGDGDFARSQDAAVEEFCRGAELLICDSQYTDEEYVYKKGWGHSRWKDSLELGLRAEAKRLAMFHHEPVRPDAALDAIEIEAKALAASRKSSLDVFCAQEGQEITL